MIASGVVRGIQERRFDVERGQLVECPFPLASLPQRFEGWRVVEGKDQKLDALTTRITGATDHVLRTYVDDVTGVTLSALVLFGPAEPVLPHTPQVCYIASGYAVAEEPTHQSIASPPHPPAVFRTGAYTKSGGRSTLREIVYHSFRMEGPWSPDIANAGKFSRKSPAIFKVQVQRRVTGGERLDRDDPIEQFLALLIPEIDRRVAASQSGQSASRLPATIQ